MKYFLIVDSDAFCERTDLASFDDFNTDEIHLDVLLGIIFVSKYRDTRDMLPTFILYDGYGDSDFMLPKFVSLSDLDTFS